MGHNSRMLLAEQLALVALHPHSGRHALSIRSNLNAALAGLLVAELVLDGHVDPGEMAGTVVPASKAPPHALLAGALGVVAEDGPKIKSILSAMERGLRARVGAGTWDATLAALEQRGAVGPEEGSVRPRREVDAAARDEIVHRLQAAADDDGAIEPRTAVVLAMTGPAQLLEQVAPERSRRKHARARIDHALDEGLLEPVADAVRRVLADAQVAVTVATTAAVTVAVSG